MEWLESIAGPQYATALMWTIFALIALLVLLVIIRIVRGMTFGTFIAGGRNRKARLAILDATAVDSQRRLVLVRRDNVEHLILIGGPTDVVVEQGIRIAAPTQRTAVDETRVAPEPAPPPRAAAIEQQAERRPAPAQPPMPTAPAKSKSAMQPFRPDDVAPTSDAGNGAVQTAPSPVPVPPAVQSPKQDASSAVTTPVSATDPTTHQRAPEPADPSHRPSPQPQAQPVPRPTAPLPAHGAVQATGQFATMKPVEATAAISAQSSDDLDDALLQELQVTLDREASPALAVDAPSVHTAASPTVAPQAPPSGQKVEPIQEREMALEEEMSRLLGDIATKR